MSKIADVLKRCDSIETNPDYQVEIKAAQVELTNMLKALERWRVGRMSSTIAMLMMHRALSDDG